MFVNGKTQYVTMSVFPSLIYRFSGIEIRISASYLWFVV